MQYHEIFIINVPLFKMFDRNKAPPSHTVSLPILEQFYFFVKSQSSLSFNDFFQTSATLLQESKNELANPGKVSMDSNSLSKIHFYAFWGHKM